MYVHRVQQRIVQRDSQHPTDMECGLCEGQYHAAVGAWGRNMREKCARNGRDWMSMLPYSRHELKIKLLWTSSPPPRPSLKLNPARGRLKQRFRSRVVAAVLAWKKPADATRAQNSSNSDHKAQISL